MERRDTDKNKASGETYAHDDAVVDEALNWFLKLKDRPQDEQLKNAFEAWLNVSPNHIIEFRNIEDLWGSKVFQAAVETLPQTSVKSKRRQPWFGFRNIAIAASLAAVTAVGAMRLPDMMLWMEADYMTATGEIQQQNLPDGSSVLLNTGSAIKFDFENGKRFVSVLKGEAFFDVKHDPEHPFRVQSAFGSVEVKGTAFSVKEATNHVDVILERGQVEVRCDCEQGAMALLRPGETITLTSDSLSAIKPIDAEQALAWRDGRVIFTDVALSDVLSELKRYYSGKIFVADDRINRLVVTGNYRLDNIEGAVRTLADAAGVTMTRIPGGIIILR